MLPLYTGSAVSGSGGEQDVPHAVRRAIHHDVGLAVAVEIARRRDVVGWPQMSSTGSRDLSTA
jgi:hypothetical protein